MLREKLESYLNTLLSCADFQDYCPNGLQVEGKAEIKKIVSGVTASQALIEAAVQNKADAILVHHGYFWKGESPTLTHIKKQRIKTLLEHELSLFAYHLPLDAHPEFGNNAQLAKLFNFEIEKGLEKHGPHDLGLVGSLEKALSVEELRQVLSARLASEVKYFGPENLEIKRVAWCSGGAQSMFESAIVEHGIDAYLSGEFSEPTFHIAHEYGVGYFALGHHASERYGVKALGEHLAKHFGIEHIFVDIPNPI